MFKSLKNAMQSGWRGNAIAEYMPTLSLMAGFSIVLITSFSTTLTARYGEVINCLDAAGDCFCPTDITFDGLKPGEILTDQIDGLTVYTEGTGGRPVVMFDTSDPMGDANFPGQGNKKDGDPDLGTPNEDFGGPGKGIGGKAGEPGENNRALGNVMVINERFPGTSRFMPPDDYGGGGDIVFEFERVTQVGTVWFLDVDDGSSSLAERVTLYNTAGDIIFEGTVPTPSNWSGHHPGNNSVFPLDIGVADVAKMRFQIKGSGAIASVVFCQE